MIRKALIMAGGFGTRMQALTKNTAKPMLPLQGKPVLQHAIEFCKRNDIHEISISIHYFGDQIKKFCGDGKKFGVRIIYVEEKEPLGTAGALRLHKDWLDQPFLMLNADDLCAVDLKKMYAQHTKTSAYGTLALTQVQDPSQYGVVALDGKRIVKFVEKPKKEDAPSKYISAGLYILEPDAVKLVPEGFCMVEKYLFPKLAEQGRLFGFSFKGQWFDVGTPETLKKAEKEWKSGNFNR